MLYQSLGLVGRFQSELAPRKPAPRLFEPLPIVPHDVEAWMCVSCRSTKRTGEMWDKDTCAACHGKKGTECTSAPASCSAKSQKPSSIQNTESSSLRGDGRTNGTPTHSTKSPTSPPASYPTPESLGWVPSVSSNENIGFAKGDYFIKNTQVWGWWCLVSKTGQYISEDGTPRNWAHYHKSVREIDALLFPAREYRVGDEVKCLEVGNNRIWETHGCAKQIGLIGIISKLEERFGEHCAAFDFTKMPHVWPVRALRLIRAVEEQ